MLECESLARRIQREQGYIVFQCAAPDRVGLYSYAEIGWMSGMHEGNVVYRVLYVGLSDWDELNAPCY